MLAVLEPALHFVASLLVTYGFNAGELYLRFYDFAAHALKITKVGPLGVVAGYFALHLLAGLVAVMLGWRVAKRAQTLPYLEKKAINTAPMSFPPPPADAVYHPVLLLFHVALLVGGFLLIKLVPLWLSAPVVLIYGAACLRYYINIRRVFRKPRLWIELLIVGILAGSLMGNIASGEIGWTWTGFVIGLQMALRAVLVTVAFASIGTELRNPRIIDWFLRRGLGTLSSSVTLAFEALPTMMAALSQEKNILRHPVQSLSRVLATGIRWLEDYNKAN
jgi:hypothetical protein